MTETSPQLRLAQKIASKVKRWSNQGVRPGDVLVLVRQRGPLFEAIIRALKDQKIDVAGADRLVLTEHIAVMDLMVLADALLLPDDDLALATALKSPLLGLDDHDLFEIAWQRRGSLRSALSSKAATQARFAVALDKLDRFAEWARRETPFGFYGKLLGPAGGRKCFLARLGQEADDALDEFLNLALDYERRETPSLQGFLAWLRASKTDVKRDMEISRNEVRVMTVHGAKGLEAPIVILADTTTPPAGPPQRQPRLLPCLETAHQQRPCVSSGPAKSNRFRPRQHGASKRAARCRGRISAASLCGDDTRDRPPGRVRRRRRARPTGRLLVGSGFRGAAAAVGRGAGRGRRRHRVALSPGGETGRRDHSLN